MAPHEFAADDVDNDGSPRVPTATAVISTAPTTGRERDLVGATTFHEGGENASRLFSQC